MSWRAVDVERLIGEDHAARATRAAGERAGRVAEIAGAQVWRESQERSAVSTGDPQARVMKQPDGGLALSYNAQLSTDAAHGLIVGVAVTQEANDYGQLLPRWIASKNG